MKTPNGWRPFMKLILNLNSTKELDQLFDLFLTIEEKHLIASRYVIIKALLEGKLPQREIAVTYGVSIAQINRGSNALKRIDAETKQFLISNFEGT